MKLEEHRAELVRDIEKLRREMEDGMILPSYRRRLDNRVTKLQIEVAEIDRKLDEASGQQPLF